MRRGFLITPIWFDLFGVVSGFFFCWTDRMMIMSIVAVWLREGRGERLHVWLFYFIVVDFTLRFLSLSLSPIIIIIIIIIREFDLNYLLVYSVVSFSSFFLPEFWQYYYLYTVRYV